jgi:L-threonate 2-dehydrogenase
MEHLQMKIGVVGLGSMGYGIATSLLRSGHQVYGVDVNPEAVRRLREEGGSQQNTTSALPELDAVVIVVLNATQTEDVLFGNEGLVTRLSPGAVVIMCVTVAPEAFEKAQPALEAIAEMVFELGDNAGGGSAMKAANQMLAGIHIVAMAEAITFAMTQGIDPTTFMTIIPKCAGTSWMLENRAPHVVAGDYTAHSAVDIWPKDLGIVLDVARASKFAAPITAAALQQFLAASGMGLGREDDAAVAKVYARNAGLKLPGADG